LIFLSEERLTGNRNLMKGGLLNGENDFEIYMFAIWYDYFKHRIITVAKGVL
jgi:hypothetical protein